MANLANNRSERYFEPLVHRPFNDISMLHPIFGVSDIAFLRVSYLFNHIILS